MNDPLAWLDAEAAAWRARGLERQLEVRGSGLVDFGTNDYLGLAHDPRVIAAAVAAAKRHGFGAGASPLVSGWTTAHEELTAALAAFEEVEAVGLYPSGFAANVGTIAALVGPGDAVYLDRLDHACLVDGARLAGARIRVYPHGDVARLGAVLGRDHGRFRRSLIATDGVFSMDGDLAPLPALADLAEQAGALLLVDEAHATGVFGPDGRGSAAACGVEGRVHVKVGTLSKALGSLGGFVAGSRRLVDWLINHARPLVYSTALPPAAAAAATAALAIARAEPWRRERLLDLGRALARSLAAAGLAVGPTAGSIVPVLLGDPGRTCAAARWLQGRGFFVPAIRPPSVPEGTARLRISLSAAHSDDAMAALAAALGEWATGSSPAAERMALGGPDR
jgi:8-amino-7-oxononanoate synthase